MLLLFLQAYIENIHIRGIKKTNEEYIKHAIKVDIFNILNFDKIILKSEELRQKLLALGCFKSVDLLIDSSKSRKINAL